MSPLQGAATSHAVAEAQKQVVSLQTQLAHLEAELQSARRASQQRESRVGALEAVLAAREAELKAKQDAALLLEHELQQARLSR